MCRHDDFYYTEMKGPLQCIPSKKSKSHGLVVSNESTINTVLRKLVDARVFLCHSQLQCTVHPALAARTSPRLIDRRKTRSKAARKHDRSGLVPGEDARVSGDVEPGLGVFHHTIRALGIDAGAGASWNWNQHERRSRRKHKHKHKHDDCGSDCLDNNDDDNDNGGTRGYDADYVYT